MAMMDAPAGANSSLGITLKEAEAEKRKQPRHIPRIRRKPGAVG